MTYKGNKHLRYLCKISMILGITVGVVLGVSQFLNFSFRDTFLTTGVIYAFIGLSSVFGDIGPRTDFGYLYTSSMRAKSSVDETRRDKNVLYPSNALLIEMAVVGILLIGIVWCL